MRTVRAREGRCGGPVQLQFPWGEDNTTASPVPMTADAVNRMGPSVAEPAGPAGAIRAERQEVR